MNKLVLYTCGLALTGVILLFIGGAALLGWLMAKPEIQGPAITTVAESCAPDGMFRCVVTEQETPGKCDTIIVLEKRKESVGPKENPWQQIRREQIHNDSCSRSNYSIDWGYDAKHRTTDVTVFGDFGSPPFEGHVLMEASLPAR